MSFKITPQEFHILVDNYVIRTRVPKGEITLGMIELRARRSNLSTGDVITVQCMSHEYDELLHEGRYRVTCRKEKIVVHEVDDHATRQVNEVTVRIEQVGDWLAFGDAHALDVPEQPALPIRRWNAGRQIHEVCVGEDVIFESRDKEQAQAVADGAPVPVAA